jgi:16S rRNA (guanine527-N7)-methyltransferase
LTLPGSTIEGLTAYFELLRKWNRKISLTSLPIEDAGEEALDRLLIEPLLAAKYLPKGNVAVLDLGSGGGSPAIPMKLASPGISLRMVEAKTRKAAFLREVVRTLELDSVAVEPVRLEELLVRPGLHDAFDVATLRAVRVDRKMLSTIHCLLRPGGLLFLFGTVEPSTAAFSPSPLLPQAGHVLLSQWGSHLQILRKPALAL